MRIFLTGMMASGKTTYAKQLATLIDYSFLDTDTLIEEQETRTVSEIFNNCGEEYFRNKESELLPQLEKKENTVIATGGGFPVFNQISNKLIEAGFVIFIKPRLEMIIKRLENNENNRPLLMNNPSGSFNDFIKEMYFQRIKFYRNAHLTIDPDILTPNLMADYLLKGKYKNAFGNCKKN